MGGEDAVCGIEDDVACDDCFLPLDGGEELDDESRSKNQTKPSKMHSKPKMEAVAAMELDDADGERAPWHPDPSVRSAQVSLWVPRSNCPRVEQKLLPCWEMLPSLK